MSASPELIRTVVNLVILIIIVVVIALAIIKSKEQDEWYHDE